MGAAIEIFVILSLFAIFILESIPLEFSPLVLFLYFTIKENHCTNERVFFLPQGLTEKSLELEYLQEKVWNAPQFFIALIPGYMIAKSLSFWGV